MPRAVSYVCQQAAPMPILFRITKPKRTKSNPMTWLNHVKLTQMMPLVIQMESLWTLTAARIYNMRDQSHLPTNQLVLLFGELLAALWTNFFFMGRLYGWLIMSRMSDSFWTFSCGRILLNTLGSWAYSDNRYRKRFLSCLQVLRKYSAVE